MTEQTDAAEVEALARIVRAETIGFDFNRNVARAVLASDWLAADRAAERARGAQAVLVAVEARFNAPDAPLDLDAALRDMLTAARAAAAAAGGGAS